jgi:hypothetical protein
MKKKTGTFTRIAVIVLVEIFTLTLAGCVTTGGSGTSPTADKQVEEDAAKLATDLNAIKAGSATVEGATVKLIGGVDLTAGLTVPEGVTLDLSGEDARLILKNGAALIVDGTVNARGHGDQGKGWVDGGLYVDDGVAIINGSGTIRLQSKGCLLNIWGDKKR